MTRIKFVSHVRLAVAVWCTVFTLNCLANPEDYYLFEYYLQDSPKPPEVVKEEVVRQIVTQSGSSRIARSFRKISKLAKVSSSFCGSVFRPRNDAGSLFDSFSFNLDVSHAEVDDDVIGGDGTDQDAGFLLTGAVGDSLSFGLGYSHNTYEVGGHFNYADFTGAMETDYEQATDAIDVFAIWMLDDNWAIGAFLSQSWVDIEDVWRLNRTTLQMQNIGDSFARWGGGFLLAFNVPVTSTANLGITNTLSSMNKSSLGALGDDEDSAWLCMIDWDQGLGDDVSVNAYWTIFNMLDPDEDSADGSYNILGLNLDWRMTSSTTLSFGYDTTMNDNDRDEHRVSLGIVLEF